MQIKKEKVTSCRCCSLFSATMDGMECLHPSLPPWPANMIISNEHLPGIPPKCPLRKGKFKISTEISLGQAR